VTVKLLEAIRPPVAKQRTRKFESCHPILPLEREGLIEIVAGRADWTEAHTRFEAAFGDQRAAKLRALLHAVTITDLAAP
jgi:hypothetical protein